MKYRSWCGGAAALAYLYCGPAIAQEESHLPVVETLLSCGKDCKSATDPKPLDDRRLRGVIGPGGIPENGIALLRATVTKDGFLKDPTVVRLIGSKRIAEKALASIEDWRYQPAMRDGVPVDRPNWEVQVTYVNPYEVDATAYDAISIKQAGALSSEGKHADAIAKLLPILLKPDLPFLVRETVSLQLALDYAHQGDVLTAREYLDDIAFIGDQFLSKDQRLAMWRMAALLNAKTGQLMEASAALQKLNAIQPVSADDPLAKVMQVNGQKLHTDKLPTALGRISKFSGLPSWSHYLTRRNFTFVKISGRLTRLSIWCGDRLLESAFSDKAEWHIPLGWDICRLDVYGEPGASFTLAEMAD